MEKEQSWIRLVYVCAYTGIISKLMEIIQELEI